ncbi:hypothetical protein [Neomoorella thermoacetica]|uniref:Uncharacterized protein n=1 Tax=Neomoorella thermoacetica TaxID=1525 RepID=A0AAC9HEX0_NEOTH|nr:hypothetical protein [Moorella thermoacetica]AOQ22731.1 hypothetical protein Maut_00248 [Moorella thermoacetica]APC07418.1 hypothetical protein MTJW_02340 [Moorella thermoacetica]OIQ53348.1 hypothetical protein MORE_20750 [Moorella thermoacetica]TYL08676.1 hypothetical protein MTAT_27340 [Moorella thermoacetica]
MLTRRRRQFLDKIKKIYQETGKPVHYIAVAEALKVSKWTAYDVLLELEKEGFLERQYIVNSNEKTPGRSMVMFVPSPLAASLEGSGGNTSSFVLDWQQARARLLDALANLLPREAGQVAGELLQEMPGKTNPVITSAYTLTILLVYLKSLGERALQVVRSALDKASRPEAGLFLATGTGLGLAVNMLSQNPLAGQLAGYLNRLQEHIENLTGREHKLLLDFLHEALERVV